MLPMLDLHQHSHWTLLEMRHGKVNAMDIEFCNALIQAIQEFESSDSLCLVIQSKTPKKVFSAGIDLKRITNEPISYTQSYFRRLIELFEKVYFCTKPTLAIVEGVAIAGGCVMAAACSARIGTESAAFGMPNKKLDVPIPQLAPVILQSTVAHEIANELHKESLLSAREAQTCGLLERLVKPNDLTQVTTETVSKLTQGNFEVRQRSSVSLAEFQPLDQAMIEAWCQPVLRQRIQEYIRSV